MCVCVCTCVWGAAACLRGCRVKTASPARIYRVHSFRVSSSYRGADRPAPPDQRRSVGRHVDSQPPSPGGPAWSPHPDLKPDTPPRSQRATRTPGQTDRRAAPLWVTRPRPVSPKPSTAWERWSDSPDRMDHPLINMPIKVLFALQGCVRERAAV